MDKTSQPLEHGNLKKEKENTKLKDWYDSERRMGSTMAKELDHCKSRLKELRSCVFNLEREVSGLKAKLSASRSMMSKLLCRGKVSWRNGFRIRASIRQLHYRLFQCRVPSSQHNKNIRCVARTFNIPLPRLCAGRTIQRLRTESGLCSFKCVAKAASCANKMAGTTRLPGRATNCERTPTKSDGQTTWWLLHKNVVQNGKSMKSGHKRPKKKPNGWLSGCVVEVHRHQAKAPAPGSRTRKSLGKGSGWRWITLQGDMAISQGDLQHEPPQVLLRLAEKSLKFTNAHQFLMRYPDSHAPKAKRTLCSVVPTLAKNAD